MNPDKFPDDYIRGLCQYCLKNESTLQSLSIKPDNVIRFNGIICTDCRVRHGIVYYKIVRKSETLGLMTDSIYFIPTDS